MESTKKKRHMKIPQKQTCEYCEREIRFGGTLEKHKQRHREEEESQLEIQRLELEGTCPRIYTCSRCQMKFLSTLRMYSHRDYLCRFSPSSVAETWPCESCHRVFDNEKGLCIHKGSCQAYTVVGDPLKIQCDKCDETFESNHSLNVHMRIHTMGTDHMCLVCGKPMKSERSLKEHMIHIHTNPKQFKCFECNQRFNRKANMMSHHKLHHVLKGERRFKCEICGKAVISKKNLKRHLDTHSGIRHKCNRCGRTYKQKRHLNIHKCVKKMEFLCQNCGMAFKGSQPFKKHQATCSASTSNHQTVANVETEAMATILNMLNKQEESNVKVVKINQSPENEMSTTGNITVTEPQVITETYDGDRVVSCTFELVTESTSEGELHSETPQTQYIEHQYQKLSDAVEEGVAPDHVVIWQCMSCSMQFEELENFQEHAQTCGKEEDDNKNLQVHAQTCEKEEDDDKNLQVHAQTCGKEDDDDKKQIANASNAKFSCMECSQSFIDVNACIKHIQSHFQRRCEKCYKVLVNDDALDDHMKVECPAVITEVVLGPKQMEKCKCSYCNKKFATKTQLDIHLEESEKRTQGGATKCPCCPKQFTKYCQLLAHTTKFRYTCKVCHVHYTHQVVFARHIKKKHRFGQSPGGEICKNCDRKFDSVEELKQHIDYSTRVANEIDFKCFQCGQQFSSKDELEKHGLSYEECNYCGLHFPRSKRCERGKQKNRYLMLHLEKEHNVTKQEGVEKKSGNPCRHCSTSFATAWELGAHVKQVLKDAGTLACTWERDTLMCLRCGKGYNEYSKLADHFKTYKYNCFVCNMHFSSHRPLWLHMDTQGHYQNSDKDLDKEDSNWKEVEVQKSDTQDNEFVIVESDSTESRNDETSTGEIEMTALGDEILDNSDQIQQGKGMKQKEQKTQKVKSCIKLSNSLPNLGPSKDSLDVVDNIYSKKSTENENEVTESDVKKSKRSRRDAKTVLLPPGRQRRPYKDSSDVVDNTKKSTENENEVTESDVKKSKRSRRDAKKVPLPPGQQRRPYKDSSDVVDNTKKSTGNENEVTESDMKKSKRSRRDAKKVPLPPGRQRRSYKDSSDVVDNTKKSTENENEVTESDVKKSKRSRRDAKKVPLPPGRQRRPYKDSSDVVDNTQKSTENENEVTESDVKKSKRSRRDAKKVPLPPGRQRRPYKQKFQTKRVACGYCGLVCRVKSRVQTHIKRFHRSGVCKWKSVKNEQAQCNYCHQIFRGPSEANYHVFKSESEMNGELSECGICGEILSAKCQVKFHAKECGKKQHEGTPGAELKDQMHEDTQGVEQKSHLAPKRKCEESLEPENYAMTPGWDIGEESHTHDPEIQVGTLDVSLDEKPNHQDNVNKELIELDPNVYYMVKFPPGMMAGVVSANEIHLKSSKMMHASGSTRDKEGSKERNISESSIVPVISVQPHTNPPSALTYGQVTKGTNTEDNTVPFVEMNTDKSGSDSVTGASSEIASPLGKQRSFVDC